MQIYTLCSSYSSENQNFLIQVVQPRCIPDSNYAFAVCVPALLTGNIKAESVAVLENTSLYTYFTTRQTSDNEDFVFEVVEDGVSCVFWEFWELFELFGMQVHCKAFV